MKTLGIHITGIVQGVGFRPFVYREAVVRGLSGWVLNAGDGVHIEAQGAEDALRSFVHAMRSAAPAAARVEQIAVEEREGPSAALVAGAFRIIASDAATEHTTLVSPDIATCPDCLRELFDPADRRYHYPFINCTNCGPRYTIIRELPYDRPRTSMAAFPLCPECATEYADPLDRRFHAQPDSCFACGPHLTWRERTRIPQEDGAEGRPGASPVAGDGTRADCPAYADGRSASENGASTPALGRTREESDAIIDRCAELLAAGRIVAIKGLGGFHLACDAANDAAVRELRRRKRRSNKPLAIMVARAETAAAWCEVNETERDLLSGTVRPIVLLRRQGRTGADNLGLAHPAAPRPLAPSVAFDLPELGVMLPYTPLQHLLLAACAARDISALVMTSGNVSEEPIEIDDERAWRHLVEGGLADALLGNDRAILSRFDDSVVRVAEDTCFPVRRARGYAPRPLALPACSVPSSCSAPPDRSTPPAILTCGAEQKATLALTRENPDGGALCFLSQHIGDLENASAFDAWHETRRRMQALFGIEPAALVCDLHPTYLSSQWARAEAERAHLPLVEAQHHHAHIASVIAEAAAAGAIDPEKPVIGIALDGTGAGTDGTIWGGEVLIASLTSFQRAAHLAPWPLPGGAAAVRDARRNAFALLKTMRLEHHPGAAALTRSFPENERTLTATMIDRGLNCPSTSSMGRFLDAVAALLGVCAQATYEGEPAIALEAVATRLAPQERASFHELGEALGKQMGEAPDRQPDKAPDRRPSEAPSRQMDKAPDGRPNETPGKQPDEAPGRRLAGVGSDERTGGRPAGAEAPIAGSAFHRPMPADSAPTMCNTPGVPASKGPDARSARILDPTHLLRAVLDNLAAGARPEELAYAVHVAIAIAFVEAAAAIGRREGITDVALSGGCFMNRLLLGLMQRELRIRGLRPLTAHEVPVNDGCIAYGQAAIARALLASRA